MYAKWTLITFTSVLYIQVIWCLRELTISGGGAVLSGSSVTLRCSYDLEGALLYSIRWYRNEEEFYRYVPKESPPSLVFSLPGLHVDLSFSDDQRVTLSGVHRQLSGEYQCEVSADAPLFHTEIKSTILLVVDIPESGPVLKVDRNSYTTGDTIKANCSLAPTFPSANLTWFINGETVEMSQTTHLPQNPEMWEACSAFSILEINTEEKSVIPRYQVGGSLQETSSQQLKIVEPEPEVTVYTVYASIDRRGESYSHDDEDFGKSLYPVRVGGVPISVTRVRMQPEIGTVLEIRCEAHIEDAYRSISEVAMIKEDTVNIALIMGHNSSGCMQRPLYICLVCLFVIWQALMLGSII